MKRIPVFDYLQQYAAIKDDVLEAVQRVLESGWLILGKEVEGFEQEFAGYLGGETKGAVGVNSGTDALTIAMRAAGIGSGAEVITVANTAVPTVSAIREVGATPIFCEVDPDTCLMSIDAAKAKVTDRTRAIVPVHLFGNVVDIERLRDAIPSQDALILEDCAQAHGATLRGRMVGTFGDAAAFSFYPTKNLGAYGDGGLCYTSDPELAARMRSIRMYGFEENYYAEREGVNSRLDELQAAILRVKMGHLPRQIEQRREIARYYDENLSGSIVRVRRSVDAEPSFHLYVIQVDDRDRVREELAAAGVATGVHYPYPIHLMRAYEFLGYGTGDLPVTERLAHRVLSLPMFPELGLDRAAQVCEAVNRVAG